MVYFSGLRYPLKLFYLTGLSLNICKRLWSFSRKRNITTLVTVTVTVTYCNNVRQQNMHLRRSAAKAYTN